MHNLKVSTFIKKKKDHDNNVKIKMESQSTQICPLTSNQHTFVKHNMRVKVFPLIAKTVSQF